MWGQTTPSVISINFASGQTNGNFSGTGGLVPVAYWNNLTDTSGSNIDLKKSDNTSSGATVTFSCKNTWTYNSNIKDNWLVGYLDDGNEISIEVSNIPYTKYSLIIYQATDTEGYGFNPPSINGTYYSWDGSKTSETRNDTKLKYGSSRKKNAMLGVNTMYLKNFTNNNNPLTIRGGGNTNSARGCIAAIQIVEEVDGNTLYPSSATQITSATSLTASKYYLIEGKDQSNNWYYLYDNGTKIQGDLLNRKEIGKYVWQLIGKDNAWVLKNIGTGKYMSLGSSDGSQISSSDKAQINSLYFAADSNATIRNSNGQAIDMTANGLTPTTWEGNQTPAGSRSLHIYETNLFATDLEAYKLSITNKVDLQKNVSVLFSDDDYTTYTTSVESATSVAEADDAYATFMASPGTDIFAVSSRGRSEGAPQYIKMSSQTTINKSEKVTNNTVYQLTHIGDGNYLFYNSETNGYWGKVETRNGAIPGAADVINAGFYRVEWNSTDNGRGDHINLKNINTTTDYFYVHESADDKVVDWNADAGASKWTIKAAASRSDILEGYNTYVGLLSTISDYEWKIADYWQLADGVTWDSDGPGCPNSGMWSPIYLKDISGGTVPTLEGWNFRMTANHSTYTIASVGKIQGGEDAYITLKNNSVVTMNFGNGHTYPLTVNLEEGDNNILNFHMSNGYNHSNCAETKCTGQITVNYGSVSKNKVRKFNASGSGAINNLVLNATLTEPTANNTIETIPLAKFEGVTYNDLSTKLLDTNGWTQVYSQEDLSTQPANGKYYYVEKTASGVTLKTYNETSKIGYTVSEASETLSEIAGSYDYYIIPEGKTLTIDEANFDLRKITGAGTVALAANTALTENNSTSATGMLKINEGITLSVESTNTSIVSFSNLTVNGTLHISTIPSTIVLSGAGVVKLSGTPTSTAPTLTDWTGSIEFPSIATAQGDLAAIFNVWGNENSTIKLHSVTGWLPGGDVNPTLNIMEDQTLTINDGSSSTTPVLNKITGAGILEQTWSGGREYTLKIGTLTGFTGTLKGTNKPIIVDRIVLNRKPAVGDLLIKISGTVSLSSLVVGWQPISAYSWTTETHDDVTGIYVTAKDDVAEKRDLANAIVLQYDGYIGAGVNKYTVSLGDDKYTSMESYNAAIGAWTTVDDYVEPSISLNMPANGFYRFTSQNNSRHTENVGKYLHNSLYNGGLALNTTKDETTIFYVDCENNRILSYADGKYLYYWDQAPTVGNRGTWTIMEGSEIGKYAIKIGSSNWYASDWNTTDHITYGLKDANALWAIEPVESLPVTFNSAAMGYATFNCPVALKVPTDVKAYVCRIDGSTIRLFNADQITDGDNWVLPAETPVLLYNEGYSTEATKYFTVASTQEKYDNNDFTGTIAAANQESGYTYYALRKMKSGTMGFHQRSDQSAALTGFRAWLRVGTGQARDFTVVFGGDSDPTGIVEALGLQNDNVEIYDLNGRKLSSYQKGVNIVNGKKVFK